MILLQWQIWKLCLVIFHVVKNDSGTNPLPWAHWILVSAKNEYHCENKAGEHSPGSKWASVGSFCSIFSLCATANGALQNQNDTQCHSHLEITKRSQTHDLLCWFALLIDFICNPLTKWCKFQGLFHVFNCSKRKSVRRKLERWQEAWPREILLPRQGTDVRRHLGSRYSKVWSSGWLWQRQRSSLY